MAELSYKDSTRSLEEEEGLLKEEEQRDFSSSRRPSRQKLWLKLLSLSAALNIVLLLVIAGWISSTWRYQHFSLPDEVYSPAHSAVRYKNAVFQTSLHGGFTEYQGSSDEVSARWEHLYNVVGMSQISAESAGRLPNATTPTAHDPTQYMVELDVFHQLHCLNLLRKLVYPAKFPTDLTSGSAEAEDTVYHLEHCYDQLRQSLQCSSDVSTIFWEWSPANGKMMGNLATTHTCRDFEAIRAWAVEHRLREPFDWFANVPGAPIRKAG